MKTAVTCIGKTLQDKVDPRFGRAKYILIIDSDSREIEIINNSNNINAFKGAGIQAATMICDKGAQTLLTGYCGPNAFKTLEAAGIKVISDVSGTVQQAIDQFNSGHLAFSSAPNAEGHW